MINGGIASVRRGNAVLRVFETDALETVILVNCLRKCLKSNYARLNHLA